MSKSRKMKEITTRLKEKKGKVKKTAVLAVDNLTEDKTLSLKSKKKGKVGFNFEAEAARFAHRHGLDKKKELTDVDLIDADIEDQSEVIVERTEHEMIGVEKDDWIEKFKKNIKYSDEEGWEAFYN